MFASSWRVLKTRHRLFRAAWNGNTIEGECIKGPCFPQLLHHAAGVVLKTTLLRWVLDSPDSPFFCQQLRNLINGLPIGSIEVPFYLIGF